MNNSLQYTLHSDQIFKVSMYLKHWMPWLPYHNETLNCKSTSTLSPLNCFYQGIFITTTSKAKWERMSFYLKIFPHIFTNYFELITWNHYWYCLLSYTNINRYILDNYQRKQSHPLFYLVFFAYENVKKEISGV